MFVGAIVSMARPPTVPITIAALAGTTFVPLSKLVMENSMSSWEGSVKFAGKYSSVPVTGLNAIVRYIRSTEPDGAAGALGAAEVAVDEPSGRATNPARRAPNTTA